jgi:hypothetical protein
MPIASTNAMVIPCRPPNMFPTQTIRAVSTPSNKAVLNQFPMMASSSQTERIMIELRLSREYNRLKYLSFYIYHLSCDGIFLS